jgi:hypothetical protein
MYRDPEFCSEYPQDQDPYFCTKEPPLDEDDIPNTWLGLTQSLITKHLAIPSALLAPAMPTARIDEVDVVA